MPDTVIGREYTKMKTTNILAWRSPQFGKEGLTTDHKAMERQNDTVSHGLQKFNSKMSFLSSL